MCGSTKRGTNADRNRQSGGSINVAGVLRKKLMKFAELDPANPLIYKECPKCKHNIAVFIEVSPGKKRFFKCRECGNHKY